MKVRLSFIFVLITSIILPAVGEPAALPGEIPSPEPAELTLVPGTVTASNEIKDAVLNVLLAADDRPAANTYAITDIQPHGGWHLLSVVGLPSLDLNLEWTLENAIWTGLILIMIQLPLYR